MTKHPSMLHCKWCSKNFKNIGLGGKSAMDRLEAHARLYHEDMLQEMFPEHFSKEVLDEDFPR